MEYLDEWRGMEKKKKDKDKDDKDGEAAIPPSSIIQIKKKKKDKVAEKKLEKKVLKQEKKEMKKLQKEVQLTELEWKKQEKKKEKQEKKLLKKHDKLVSPVEMFHSSYMYETLPTMQTTSQSHSAPAALMRAMSPPPPSELVVGSPSERLEGTQHAQGQMVVQEIAADNRDLLWESQELEAALAFLRTFSKQSSRQTTLRREMNVEGAY